MDPSEYPFVRNGPDCMWCHHARLEHVGWNERYEMPSHDRHCQVPGCESCGPAGYWPLGPLSYPVLQAHDLAELETIWVAEAKASQRLRTQALGALWGSVIVMTAANVASHLLGWTALALVLMLAALALITVYAGALWQATRRANSSGLLLVSVLMTVPVLVLKTVETVVTVPWSWVAMLGLVGLAVILVAIDHWQSARRYRRIQQRMMEDLADLIVPPGYQPLAVISVRVTDTDELQSPGD